MPTKVSLTLPTDYDPSRVMGALQKLGVPSTRLFGSYVVGGASDAVGFTARTKAWRQRSTDSENWSSVANAKGAREQLVYLGRELTGGAGALAVLCSSCAASYLTLLAFHVNHIQGETEHVGYAPGVDWGAHQLHTTANFDAGSGFFGLSGGLDLQVEHHLFPQLSYDKQRSVRPLVRATAREHGLPYHEFSSLGAGLGSIVG